MLYGSVHAKTIRVFSGFFLMPGPARQIYGLQSGGERDGDIYEYNYNQAIGDEQAETAVAAARLDYHTLAARAIFVGKGIARDEDSQPNIEVVRVLEGTHPKPGEKITVRPRCRR